MRSAYADRDTVGTIAQQALRSKERVTCGDMSNELIKSCADDINETIAIKPYGDRPFYITIHEKKDLQIRNAILRRVVHTEYRPFPEPNTSVFWADPVSGEVNYCWSLPHQTLFRQYLSSPSKYAHDTIKFILAYNMERNDIFGFYKHGENEKGVPIYFPIPGFKYKPLINIKNHRKTLCLSA